MIEAKNITKKFRQQTAVDNISFNIEEGENFVLLGTSGCGKTTTLKMLNRLIEPTAGSIYINQKNIEEQNAETLRRSIGYVLQNTGLFPHYTVAENIAVVPNLFKWNKEKIRLRVEELMRKLHLSKEYYNAYPNELSGGQQQRVGLARALAADAAILLMDEPFGALDPITRTKVRTDFINLEEFKKKTIVLVTHDVQEAFELADRICLMDKGKIIQTGTPAELLFKPVDSFVKTFFDEQRLQLEYKSVTLQMLWQFLKDDHSNTSSLKEISSQTNIWQALEYLNTNNDDSVSTKNNNTVKEINYASLMHAFNQYKKYN
ncbi:ABC transporter ATP-binding protein [Parafilimonas terrae]|jgi:osmoprotectant transport system ATP-binding protein|uniref:Osmoprotectant transport system ATP-binding protein n=1 Tax=Parafilimonas terrae TaxID=1465490 RepID=A0A1I5SF11_9BACT|nr:ABC transporter ATP-binding protein [Parafilimonas terrae]SFP69330.1 osmoprotectant transport system ATP-binding protein [Parafilimonas terrae]